MKSRIFREVSLARLASPEQLDQVIRLSSSKSWAALIAILLVSAGAAVWAFEGSIPTTVSGTGMIVRPGGLLNVVARGAGVVHRVDVAVGEHVKANQPVARIAQPALVEKMRGMKQALTEYEQTRGRRLTLRQSEARLRLQALERQEENTCREIDEAVEQARLVREEIAGLDKLAEQGLVTRQETISARQKLIGIESGAERKRAELKQLSAQKFTVTSEIAREDGEMLFEISRMRRDIATFETELSLVDTVVAPFAGQVVEVKVSPGGTVGEAAPILTIQPEVDALEALIYVSSTLAKDIRSGMAAQVSPSTVKREEFGFLHGRVTFVADYPSTQAALMRNFQNEALANALTAAGPVTELRVALERDPAMPGRFRWSSSRGPTAPLSSGTFCVADIVTRRRAPVRLLLPSLTDALGAN